MSIRSFLVVSLVFTTIIWACNESEHTAHLISDSKIRSNLTKYVNYRDTLLTKEGLYLIALIRDDTSFLRKDLKNEVNSYSQPDTNVTKILRDYSKIDQIRKDNHTQTNSYRLQVNSTLSWSVIDIIFSENLKKQTYPMTIRHFGYSYNAMDKLDLDTVLIEDRIFLTKDQWNTFIQKINSSYFWALSDTYEINDIDGSIWTPSGITNKGSTNSIFHSVTTNQPYEGSFKGACVYLMQISGYDFSAYY